MVQCWTVSVLRYVRYEALSRLLYIYSMGGASKTRPLFILLSITWSYKEIMDNWAQITDRLPDLFFMQLGVDDKNLLMLYPCLSLVYFQNHCLPDPFSEHDGNFIAVFTWPTVHEKH